MFISESPKGARNRVLGLRIPPGVFVNPYKSSHLRLALSFGRNSPGVPVICDLQQVPGIMPGAPVDAVADYVMMQEAIEFLGVLLGRQEHMAHNVVRPTRDPHLPPAPDSTTARRPLRSQWPVRHSARRAAAMHCRLTHCKNALC